MNEQETIQEKAILVGCQLPHILSLIHISTVYLVC
ncbi:hypothetical protein ACFRAJ_18885, partial [Bacillus subtilis]